MSLKTIVQTAFSRMGLPKPDYVMVSADGGVHQMCALANQEGLELAQRHNWQALTKEHQITTTATETQAGAMPSDFSRFVNNTFFNRSRNYPVEGPVDPKDWQQYKADNFVGPYQLFRVRGDDMMLMPIPLANEDLAFEYVSKNWVADDKAEMNADDDTPLLDEELITLGCIWRYLSAKSLDHAQAFQDYEARVNNAIARDGGVRDLNFSGSGSRHQGLWRNVETA